MFPFLYVCLCVLVRLCSPVCAHVEASVWSHVSSIKVSPPVFVVGGGGFCFWREVFYWPRSLLSWLACLSRELQWVTRMSLFSSARLTEHPASTWARESKLRSSRSCVKHIPTEHLPRPRWRTAGVKDYRTLVPTPSTKVLYHFPSTANGNTLAQTPQENPLNPSSNFVAI